MIISHKYKFIFIKTFKTASTSVEAYFSQYAGSNDILTPITPLVAGHQPKNHAGFFNHMSGEEIKKLINPIIWKSYFKFCIERNPFEKVLSFYWMEKAKYHKLTIDDFLNFDNIGVNIHLYTEKRGKTLVDKIVRYEDLFQQLSSVFSALAIPFEKGLTTKAKTEFRKDHRHYHDVLTPKQQELIKEKFKEEINFYKYEN